jgi:hypothetical protein
MIEFHSSTGSLLDRATVENSAPHTAAAMPIEFLIANTPHEHFPKERIPCRYANQ